MGTSQASDFSIGPHTQGVLGCLWIVLWTQLLAWLSHPPVVQAKGTESPILINTQVLVKLPQDHTVSEILL